MNIFDRSEVATAKTVCPRCNGLIDVVEKVGFKTEYVGTQNEVRVWSVTATCLHCFQKVTASYRMLKYP